MALLRKPPREKLSFFQSSIPYLHNNGLSVRLIYRTRVRLKYEPRPSSHPIFGLSRGHYGIYFTLFNHEFRREERLAMATSHAPLIVMIGPSDNMLLMVPEFLITKAKQEVMSNISKIELALKELLLTLSLVKSRSLLKNLIQARQFSVSARQANQETEKFMKIEELGQSSAETGKTLNPESEPEDKFEEDFLQRLLENIRQTYFSHSSPAELDVIYPMYQALKRNNISLPTTADYNVVLRSIVMRRLDSEPGLAALESRLTVLLTVYEDMLTACKANVDAKPTEETYTIVLSEIFCAVAQADALGARCGEAKTKAEEFGLVGCQLFSSISPLAMDLHQVLPNLLAFLNNHPHLITDAYLQSILSLPLQRSNNPSYFTGYIGLITHVSSSGIEMSKKERYDLAVSVYDKFKRLSDVHISLQEAEFSVYGALVEFMVRNGNLGMATNLMDQILVEYKFKVTAEIFGTKEATQISDLISRYLEAVMCEVGLERAYDLLLKFRLVPYIPDLSISFYNTMINALVDRYLVVEIQKSDAEKEASATLEQVEVYNQLWSLYDYAVVRKDYNSLAVSRHCRDSLLSLSLDLCDHPHVARLLKEILLSDFQLKDRNVLQKIFLYLAQGTQTHGNTYYGSLAWALFEQQAAFHGDADGLTQFVSANVPYLLTGDAFSKQNLLRSLAIWRSFNSFDLESHNITGLMSVMYCLMSMNNFTSEEAQLFMQMEARLINEFEDPDNHYIQISSELEHFKLQISTHFTKNWTQSVQVTDEIVAACRLLNLDTSFETTPKKLSNGHLEVDLSFLMTINVDAGSDRFAEYFNLGYNFNEATWRAMANGNFVFGVLERNKHVRISDLVVRLMASAFDDGTKAEVLSSFITFGEEKINIEIFKTLASRDLHMLAKVVLPFTDFLVKSENKYFLDLFNGKAPEIMQINSDLSWINQYLTKLIATGNPGLVLDLLEEQQIFDLDLSLELEKDLFCSYVFAKINAKKSQDVNLLLKHHFSGKEGNLRLMNSEKLVCTLINFYISQGLQSVVLGQFEALRLRSNEVERLLLFCELLEGKPSKALNSSKSLESIALSLLNEKDPRAMKSTYDSSKALFHSKSEVFNTMMRCLTKAAQVGGSEIAAQLLARFEKTVKFCKYYRLRTLKVESLIIIIQFLSAIKCLRLLNIIANKLVSGGEVLPLIEFYFLEVKIENEHDTSVVLKELKNALQNVDDEINLSMLNTLSV